MTQQRPSTVNVSLEADRPVCMSLRYDYEIWNGKHFIRVHNMFPTNISNGIFVLNTAQLVKCVFGLPFVVWALEDESLVVERRYDRRTLYCFTTSIVATDPSLGAILLVYQDRIARVLCSTQIMDLSHVESAHAPCRPESRTWAHAIYNHAEGCLQIFRLHPQSWKSSTPDSHIPCRQQRLLL